MFSNRKLDNQPAIILNNNDDCTISHGQKTKSLGIKMGELLFKLKDIIEKHNVKILSSNYKLYTEISKYFHSILADFVRPTNQEIYAVDKSYLNLSACIYLHNLID